MRSRRFRCAGRNERRYYKYVPMLLEADGAAPRRRFHQHARRDGGSCMYNTQGRVLIILYLICSSISACTTTPTLHRHRGCASHACDICISLTIIRVRASRDMFGCRGRRDRRSCSPSLRDVCTLLHRHRDRTGADDAPFMPEVRVAILDRGRPCAGIAVARTVVRVPSCRGTQPYK